MKWPVDYRFVITCVVMIVFLTRPTRAFSVELVIPGEELVAFIDSARRPAPKKQDDKRPDDDKKRNRDRPDVIKEIPRARRLPKPTSVTERVRVKRPPIRRPAGVIKRNIGLH